MTSDLRDKLFNPAQAIEHPLTLWSLVVIVAALVLAGATAMALKRTGQIGDVLYAEIMSRWRSWLVLAVILVAPIVVGPAWVIAGVAILSLLCYAEYARATGMAGEKVIHAFVVLGILLIAFAALDNYPRLFFACASFMVGFISIATIPQDRPKGFVRRVALGVLGFLLFGFCLGYIGLFANHPGYRPMLILILLAVALNDVFGFCVGKCIGGPKVIPNTSPGKTWSGCIGALVLTTGFVVVLGRIVFNGTPMADLGRLAVLGALLSVLGQFGDLLLSSIKRDVGIKDMGSLIPGHGGVLDRFDSLVLVPPAAFHFLSLFLGPIGADAPQQVLTGGWF